MKMVEIIEHAIATSAHECGHIVILFNEGRFVSFHFLPHEVAADGDLGVFVVNRDIENTPQDCVALAGGMAGEKVGLSRGRSKRVLVDESEILRLVRLSIEDFVPAAELVLQQNRQFFNRLHAEVSRRIIELFLKIDPNYWSALSDVSIITPPEVEEIYKRVNPAAAGGPG